MDAFLSKADDVNEFNRKFFVGDNQATKIGHGAIGGKASGLASVHNTIKSQIGDRSDQGIEVNIPRMAVIATDYFDSFMQMNNLYDFLLSDVSDDRIGHAFQKADLPVQLLGDLRALAVEVTVPLAIRSSSLLEDALGHPFAGVYGTKMIPNNSTDPDKRFRHLCEAVKFVYASTFFCDAARYLKSIGKELVEEKMAVIIQEIVGSKHNDRFYPDISGVGRSYNYYSNHGSRPEDGVVNLALGLGKTIVDGGLSWSYCPAYPKAPPPFADPGDMMKNTQTQFWSVNMGPPPAYDPLKEAEYLVASQLGKAEDDGAMRYVASTYEPRSDRMCPGIGIDGPRIINFAPLLVLREIPVNDVIDELLEKCKRDTGADVEIEFAITLGPDRGLPARIGLLQVRPMAVATDNVEVSSEILKDDKMVLASEMVMGNGEIELEDIVYVCPENFEPIHTSNIALEVSKINANLAKEDRPYLLIGFGRWATSDKWRGIPVVWSQIAKAKVIVEVELEGMETDLSQGSHFFHNMTSFNVCYLSIPKNSSHTVDWKWLEEQSTIAQTDFVKHVRTDKPFNVLVDGRGRRGVVLRND